MVFTNTGKRQCSHFATRPPRYWTPSMIDISPWEMFALCFSSDWYTRQLAIVNTFHATRSDVRTCEFHVFILHMLVVYLMIRDMQNSDNRICKATNVQRDERQKTRPVCLRSTKISRSQAYQLKFLTIKIYIFKSKIYIVYISEYPTYTYENSYLTTYLAFCFYQVLRNIR